MRSWRNLCPLVRFFVFIGNNTVLFSFFSVFSIVDFFLVFLSTNLLLNQIFPRYLVKLRCHDSHSLFKIFVSRLKSDMYFYIKIARWIQMFPDIQSDYVAGLYSGLQIRSCRIRWVQLQSKCKHQYCIERGFRQRGFLLYYVSLSIVPFLNKQLLCYAFSQCCQLTQFVKTVLEKCILSVLISWIGEGQVRCKTGKGWWVCAG